MGNLISMTDFVLKQIEIYNGIVYDNEYDALQDLKISIENYANFLKKTLSIEMFVPCKLVNGVWVVLEEPFYYKDFVFNLFDKISEFDKIKCQEYQEAKERCLFEGFEVKFKDCKEFKYQSEKIILVINESTYLEYNCYYKSFILYFDNEIIFSNISTIEDIVKYKPKLTATAQKMIGL